MSPHLWMGVPFHLFTGEGLFKEMLRAGAARGERGAVPGDAALVQVIERLTERLQVVTAEVDHDMALDPERFAQVQCAEGHLDLGVARGGVVVVERVDAQ
ncbi:MAG: hypothetical protein M5U12_00255 [Verrucomicrobia bacterium]|nr:hypothetical protein [Verrucomicrobiota bacterium]